MTTAEIMEALTLTDENIEELMALKDEELAQVGTHELEAVGREYDKARGQGAFRALPLFDKLRFLFQAAAHSGYAEALHDVQRAQGLSMRAEA